jgi:hypothetical protein
MQVDPKPQQRSEKPVLKPKQRRQKAQNDNFSDKLVDRILDSQCTLTWKQTIGMLSKSQKDFVAKSIKSSINGVRPKRLVLATEPDMYCLESDSNSDEEKVETRIDLIEPVNKDVESYYCYTLLTIHGIQVPAFLDKGSHLSVITSEMCNKLNVSFVKQNGKFISPYGGEKLAIIGSAHVIIEIIPNVKVKIEFVVVEKAIIPLLIGLDVLQSLEASEDYDNNILNWNAFDQTVRTQLFSKQELEQFDDMSDDDETAYYTFQLAHYDVMEVGIPKLEENIPDILTKELRQEPEVDVIDEIDPLPLQKQNCTSFEERVHSYLENTSMNLNSKGKERLGNLILEYPEVFPESIADMSRMKNVEFTIELKEGYEPKRAKPKLYSEKERKVLDELIEVGMKSKHPFLRWSDSPFAENFTFSPKPDGSLRICTACVRLNQCTVVEPFTIPLIDDCLKFAADSTYCSIMDCMSGYWQMPVAESSIKYLAFHTHRGLVEFLVLPFGVRNGVFVFQRHMEQSFCFVIHEGNVRCYLDDIFAKSSCENDHFMLLEKIFNICKSKGISLKLSKCKFFAKEFVYLGYLFKDGLVQPNPTKVDILLSKKPPRNAKELRTFIGMVEYFSRFIPNLANMLIPLRALLKKNAYWDWNPECTEIFELLKDRLASSPCLKILDDHNDLFLSTDASNFALGSCLEQYDDHGVLHPVAYYSKVFQGAQKNYCTYEKECLAIVESLKKFRTWLLGRSFVCFTDNTAVSRLLRLENDVYGRQARWCQFLSEFDMLLKHRIGKENQVADYLSRSVNFCCMMNKFQEIGFEDIRKYLIDGSIGIGITNDSRFRRTVRKYCVIDDELYRFDMNGNHLKVLYTKEELFQILAVLHDQLGHFGFKIVAKWLFPKFWRPHMGNEIKEYLRSCHGCQTYDLRKPVYKFNGKSEISGLFHICSIDYLGPFPTSDKGNCYILNCIEHLSRFFFGMATADTTTLSSITVLRELVTLFGPPKKLKSDQDASFRSSKFKDYCLSHGIELDLVPSYTPEWVGMVERLNGIVRYALAKCCLGNYSKFEEYLPEIYFGIRAHVHSDTGLSPYCVLYGLEPNLPLSNIDYTILKNVSLKGREIELAILPGIRTAIQRAKRLATNIVKFKEGQYVKVLHGSLRKSTLVDKKKPRYVGPFKITKVYPHDLY